MNKLKGIDFLTLMDYTRDEIDLLLDVASKLKAKRARRERHEFLKGRTIAMIFEKRSTRTRTSFQAAIAHLGAQSFYMRPQEMQLSRGEPIKDTARVIDRYCDGLVIRTYEQKKVEEYAECMKNPVINALTDLTHPCQGLADFLTIKEKKGRTEGIKIAYTGDIWNVCHSLLVGSSLLGASIYVARPKSYNPDSKILRFAEEKSAKDP